MGYNLVVALSTTKTTKVAPYRVGRAVWLGYSSETIIPYLEQSRDLAIESTKVDYSEQEDDSPTVDHQCGLALLAVGEVEDTVLSVIREEELVVSTISHSCQVRIRVSR